MTAEQAFRFGRADHLIGIAGLPATPAPVGAIVLNAGMVHRVGPFRLHVDLTRRLNAAGYPTLRMDLSTLGDSGASGQNQSHATEVLADVADAMNLLGTHAGCERFVLIGLCAGAANSHTVACVNPRVAGVVFIDGYVYRTFGFNLRHYLPRLLSPVRVLRRVARMARQRRKPEGRAVFEVTVPPRDQVRRNYADMLARGLKLCFIYSGGISEHFNHARQFGEIYGPLARDPGASVHYLAHTDHTYALTADRKLLIDTITDWFADRFPLANRR
ncbi:MAG: alpha/beta hydrolase [Rhodanobacter sp.]|nr:MAG: alpha/beta hydrolase [Rhodanobacter sp.]TAM13338.1 MAG: alpha/beta hydrolase [Rhodanobacter sp.]TAM35103.1 MAG: alpha/beta hydrolase [Rhodanobacter sp.]